MELYREGESIFFQKGTNILEAKLIDHQQVEIVDWVVDPDQAKARDFLFLNLLLWAGRKYKVVQVFLN